MPRSKNETLEDIETMESSAKGASNVIYESARRHYENIFDRAFAAVETDLGQVAGAARAVIEDNAQLAAHLRILVEAKPADDLPMTLLCAL